MEDRFKPFAATKSERIEARVSAEQKQIFQYAAQLLGLSVSDFLTMSGQRAAEAAIREHNIIALSAKDSLAFAEAFLNPAEPTEEMREAYALYKEEVTSR